MRIAKTIRGVAYLKMDPPRHRGEKESLSRGSAMLFSSTVRTNAGVGCRNYDMVLRLTGERK